MLKREEALILQLLSESPQREAHALELIAQSQGQLKRGTIYIALTDLEHSGAIEAWREQGDLGLGRQKYRLPLRSTIS